ncbi:carbohydrate ABC transporter permease [uncultured Alsobacter sp.]|uniref:carbohydrate ABC transporter permease n=1 Tax=uncultured Alsobacter sp. TaxID=1748258 RepID=UPI0026000545|nr:sugar ABC transporter permease [uncultured Alsobacter sp.]
MARGLKPRRETLIAWGLLTPALVLVAGLVAYPIYSIVATSLRVGRAPNIARLDRLPVGFGNFERALTDEVVWAAAGRTVFFAVGVIGPAFLIGLGLALLLNREFPGRRVIRSLMLLPWAVPGVVAAIASLWMFDASYGVVNAGLRGLGWSGGDVAWFSNARTAPWAVLLPAVWKCFPFFVLTILAALQSIPIALYEAARMDGANRWQLFRNVTWPGIRGAAALALVLQTLWVVKDFDIIFATTGGGPSRATQTLSLLVYEEAFQFFRLGMASAIGILLLAGCAVLSWLSLKRDEAHG